MLDLMTIAAADTSVLHLRSAADQPLLYPTGAQDEKGKPVMAPVTVTVYGPGSDEYQRAQARHQQRLLDRMQKRGKMAAPSPDEKRTEQAELLAACTVASEGLTYGDASGHQMFLQIYADPRLGFITAQVSAHISDWESFTPGSATN